MATGLSRLVLRHLSAEGHFHICGRCTLPIISQSSYWRNEMRCARHRLRHRNTLSRLSRLTMLMEYIDVYMEYLYVEFVCSNLCTHNYIIYGEGTAFVRRHTEQPQTPPLPGARRAQFTCRAICCAVRMTVGP